MAETNILPFPTDRARAVSSDNTAGQSGSPSLLSAVRSTGQIGEPQLGEAAVYTPSGRLTPLGSRWRRRLDCQRRPRAWREIDANMEAAEDAMDMALAVGDGPAADLALKEWEEAAELAIFFPSESRNDLRARLRLVAHFCGSRDPIGSYLSTTWHDRSPVERLFGALDWHIYRAESREADAKSPDRIYRRVVDRTANDNGQVPGR